MKNLYFSLNSLSPGQVAKALGSKAILEGRVNLPRMEEDSEILEPEEIEALVEHLPPRDGTIDLPTVTIPKEFVILPFKKRLLGASGALPTQ